jgi:nitrogen fixation protein NifX
MTRTQSTMREVAQRIRMAVRTLPGVDAREFVMALTAKLGEPLTEEKLSQLTVGDLKAMIQGDEIVEPDVTRDQIKAAVHCLCGDGAAQSDVPVALDYVEGDMRGSLRVAVASNNGEDLDGHFGSCLRFLVYQVSRSEVRLIGVRSTLVNEAVQDKNAARARLIDDCHLVYVQSIGGPAAAKVVRAGVHPVKLPEGGPAAVALARLQASLSTPPPWLAKIMGVEAASLARFSQDAEA